jgi:hypothetical protein
MLTKLKIALALSATLISGVAGVAAANGFDNADAGPRAGLLQKYDLNGDGKLDAAEKAAMKADFQAKRAAKKAEMLAKYDTNKDGKLEPAERQVMREDMATKRFEKMDTNKDGVVSMAEFQAAAARHKGGGFRHRGHGRGGWGRHGNGPRANGPGPSFGPGTDGPINK